MFGFDSMERRMAALFVLALVLVAWQGTRLEPLHPPPLATAWTGGEQAFPIAAPSWLGPVVLPAEATARYRALYPHSSLWPGLRPSGDCLALIRTSVSTWVRRPLEARLLPQPAGAKAVPLRYSAADFLDDEDGDGDPLDQGELTATGPGAEVEVFCPPPSWEATP